MLACEVLCCDLGGGVEEEWRGKGGEGAVVSGMGDVVEMLWEGVS